jgi:serine/threonine protein kinase
MTEAADTQADAYPRRGDILEEKYEIHEVLGAGAMGCVLKAQHLLRRVPVALKFVSPAILGNREIVERFLNEGVASSKIDSDHVVKVFDVSKLPSGVPYIVMELLEGEDLYRLLRREGKPYLEDVQRAVYFTLQILRGLQAAHRVNIVHRDMKPANCFVTSKDGEPDFIKIVDFGISKIRRDEGDAGLDLTSAQAALGTPLYMSLEQARSPKDVDARSDLYSVAVILYELLGGITPFVPQSGTLSELFTMIALEQPPPLSDLRPELPEALVRAVHKGLHKDRAARYQSAPRWPRPSRPSPTSAATICSRAS